VLYMKMKKIEKLDLHGIKHVNVEDKLLEHFFVNQNCESQIITGNSTAMQNIVIKFLDEYEYKYYIPSNNLGVINVVG